MDQQDINTPDCGRQFPSTFFPVDINPALQHIPLTTPRDYTRAIIREVADLYGVRVDDILYGDRTARNVAARRQAIVAVIRAKPHLSYPQVARIFNMDHTTCVHHAQVAGLASRKAGATHD
jgi:chromosomal replication initiation ATPase DnaA